MLQASLVPEVDLPQPHWLLLVEVGCLSATGTASGCIVHCCGQTFPSFGPIPGAADQLHMLKCKRGRLHSYTVKHENNDLTYTYTGCMTAVALQLVYWGIFGLPGRTIPSCPETGVLAILQGLLV